MLPHAEHQSSLRGPPEPENGGQILPSLSSAMQSPRLPLSIFSKFLMSDIPRETSRIKLINFLLTPGFGETPGPNVVPHVQFGVVMTESRLDDELNVAAIEFTNTPKWLQALNRDPCGFPKFTPLGTIWRGVDRNAIDEHGQTEFIRAVRKGKQGMNFYYAEMLVEFHDTDINVQDLLGRTALHWACVAPAVPDMVSLCLSVPQCDIGLRNNDGLTAFDLAVQSGNELIQSLFYHSMLEMETTQPQAALLRILSLTSKPASEIDRLEFPGEAMFDPVEAGNGPLVKALIARGIDLTARNDDGDTALHHAVAKAQSLEITTLLLEAGSDVNALGHGGATPLHYAVHIAADQKMVQVLIDHKANVGAQDQCGRTALQLAEENLDGRLVMLLKGVIDTDRCPLAAKTLAEEFLDVEPLVLQQDATDIDGPPLAAKKDSAVVKVPAGDINVKDKEGRTALHRAVLDRDLDTLRILLEMGAATEAGDRESQTPLHLAAMGGHTETIKILLASGAQIEALNRFRNTALHLAGWNGHAEAVKTLLASHAPIEARNRIGHNALHCAAWAGNTDIVTILLDAGAQIDAQSNDGTALQQALIGKHKEAAKILRARGALSIVGRFGHGVFEQLGLTDTTRKPRG